MVKSSLGAALGQLFLTIPEPSGLLLDVIHSMLFALAMVAVSLPKLTATLLEKHK